MLETYMLIAQAASLMACSITAYFAKGYISLPLGAQRKSSIPLLRYLNIDLQDGKANVEKWETTKGLSLLGFSH